MRNWRTLTVLFASLALAACGGRDDDDGDDNNPPAATGYTVGGTVNGLKGTGLKLKNNGGDELAVAGNSFTFVTKIAQGGAYAVTVSAQPTGQTCAVTNGTGTVGTANVTNVTVTCTDVAANTYTVGGTVAGLPASTTVNLKLNGGADLPVAANGPFTFPNGLATGTAYTVTVSTQPAGQTCTVANGTGTIAATNVNNVTVTCEAAQPVVTPNVVLLRVGDGTTPAPTSSTSAAVTLLEYAPEASAAAPVKTVATIDPAVFSIQYGSTSEGALSRSEDGHFLAFGAYRKPAGTASVASSGTDAADVNAVRVAVGVSAAGALTTVDFPTAFFDNGIRSATTDNGSNFWVAGNSPLVSGATGSFTGGVWYASTTATTPVQITSNPNNARWVQVYGGQLYVSSASTSGTGYVGVNTVGTGKPTAKITGNSVLLANTGAEGSPYGYAFVDSDGNGTADVLYVASDNAATTANTLHVAKFTSTNGTAWTQVTGFAPAFTSASPGTRGLAAGRAADGGIIVYAVTGTFIQQPQPPAPQLPPNPDDNKLVFFTDDGVSKTPAVSVVTTAEAGYNFRGVALAPNP